ncbi:MAG TPA: hypothetical protein GX017_09495 [Clostridiales bacterium]|jgi:predicted  nucleic acid-binding Zn-ribbon protein|nr:hypothetical protein [Clostridiales bacterium]
MEGLNTLWKYQELDLLMDQYILEKKNSDSRQKLVKLKNYLIKQEENLVSMDKDADRKMNLIDKMQREYTGLSDRIQAQLAKLKSEEEILPEELEVIIKEGMALNDRIRRKEEELKKLTQEMKDFQSRLANIQRKVANAKKEYVDVKKHYDVEVKKINEELGKLKEQRDKIGEGIDKALLAKYKNIKASRSPVISILMGNQCDGCFMSLASLVVQRVKDGKRIVECENCGRILFDKESIPS